jgi:hypothetical protein
MCAVGVCVSQVVVGADCNGFRPMCVSEFSTGEDSAKHTSGGFGGRSSLASGNYGAPVTATGSIDAGNAANAPAGHPEEKQFLQFSSEWLAVEDPHAKYSVVHPGQVGGWVGGRGFLGRVVVVRRGSVSVVFVGARVAIAVEVCQRGEWR